MKKVMIISFSLLVVAGCVFLLSHKQFILSLNNSTDVVCVQSATTADCAKLKAAQGAISPTSTKLDTIEWDTYSSDSLGISFKFPTKDTNLSKYWGVSSMSAQVSIPLESGSVIYGYATAKGYVSEKGGFVVGTEGFVKKNGKYYAITRDNSFNLPLQVDEVWILSKGGEVPVQYYKVVENSESGYQPMAAYINLPGPTFTGITFALFPRGAHQISDADIATFKKIVMSVVVAR